MTPTGDPMVELRAFGPMDLGDERGPLAAILAQPKRAALAAFLALARPRRLHRREELLALFWPELDETHARNALSQALSFLRRELPDGVLVARGTDEVGLDPERVKCDVVAFDGAVAGGQWAEALALYRGELLAGLHVSDAPRFGRWLDEERHRLRELASGAAWSLADELLGAGEPVQAERAAQRALALSPTDESPARRFIEALARAGDRAAALRFYERFCALLAEELEVEPAPETAAVVEAVRSGEVVADIDPGASAGESGQPPTAPERPPGAPREAAPEDARHGAPDTEAAEPGEAGATEPGLPQKRAFPARISRRTWAGAAVVAVLALIGLIAFMRQGDTTPELVPNRVVVLPFDNETDDPALNGMAALAADHVSQAIQAVDRVEAIPVRSARAYAAEAAREGRTDLIQAVAERTGSGLAVAGTLHGLGDSVQYHLDIIDVATGTSLQPVSETGPRDRPEDSLHRLGSRVAGGLFLLDRDWPRVYAPLLEAARELQLGWAAQERGDWARGEEHYLAASRADTDFVVAVAWAGQAARDRDDWSFADSLAREADRRRHLLSEMEVLVLDDLIARLDGDLHAILRVAREKNRRSGARMGIDHCAAALDVNLPREALEALADSEPEDVAGNSVWWFSWYWACAAEALHVLGDHEEELAVARRGRERYPTSRMIVIHEIAALAALGRVDEVSELVARGLELPDQTGHPAQAALFGGGELRAHGYPEAARAAFERGIEWLRQGGPEEGDRRLQGHHDDRLALARLLYFSEQWEEAQAVFRELAAEDPDNAYALGGMGRTAARLGDRAEAQRVSGQLATLREGGHPWEHLWEPVWERALIAGALGDPDEAMALLREAFSKGMRYRSHMGVQVHRHIDLESLRQREDYQELMRPKG